MSFLVHMTRSFSRTWQRSSFGDSGLAEEGVKTSTVVVGSHYFFLGCLRSGAQDLVLLCLGCGKVINPGLQRAGRVRLAYC